MARTRNGVAKPSKDAAPIAPPQSATPTTTPIFTAANGAANTNTAPAAIPHNALASDSIAYAASAALLAARAIDASEIPPAASQSEAEIHPDLRSPRSPSDQLQPQPQSQYPPLAPVIMESAVSPGAPAVPVAVSTSPQAALAAPPAQAISPKSADEGGQEVVTDGRRGQKRELSTTKRAAQNRAAQRAFRQRKEGYIKKLEKQVLESAEMENAYKMTQSENYALREYIIHLQSRLLDAKAELPHPPANLNLAAPGMPPILGLGPPPAAMAQQRHEQELQQQERQRQLQHQRDFDQQKANTPLAAREATVSVPTESPPAATESPAMASAGKDDSSLARVAQAVAQLGSSDPAANGITENVNGIDVGDIKMETGQGADEDPMDTTEETINQSLQTMQQPVASM
ncbi:hypothetical protein SEPCBS119000_003446 [Sporothrix epigloea]|uniref:Putative transcription factor kapC n=1 Tax=Sporothrix epigloea TaxID=1892477 RepID=A0ABP0DLM9_9PEZI